MGWGTGELQFRTCKKPSIYGDDFLSQGMSVLSQYFHIVSTKCTMNKILATFIYLKYNKTNLKTPLKSKDRNRYLQLNFIDYILTPFWVPSKLFLQHVTSDFKCIFITCTRGYQKVRRLMLWNQYLLSYAYKFSREYKTINVLSVVKIWAI